MYSGFQLERAVVSSITVALVIQRDLAFKCGVDPDPLVLHYW